MQPNLNSDRYGFRVARIGESPSGDYNHDGNVDAADYIVWRKALGTTYTQDDYNVWRANFGRAVASTSARARAESSENFDDAPEPSSVLLLLLGLAAVCLARRRCLWPIQCFFHPAAIDPRDYPRVAPFLSQ
jgi:hypothetical protein